MQGLLTIVLASASYFWVHNYPDTVSFLSPEEKELLHNRLRDDNDALSGEKFSWKYVLITFSDPSVWLYCFCFMGCSLPLYTLSLFLVSNHATLIQITRLDLKLTRSQPSSTISGTQQRTRSC